MRMDRFTQKAQESLLEAQNQAQQYNQAQIEPEHLLLALVDQEGGVVPAILAKIGVSAQTIREDLVRWGCLPRSVGCWTRHSPLQTQ